MWHFHGLVSQIFTIMHTITRTAELRGHFQTALKGEGEFVLVTDAVLAASDVVIDHVYHTKACQQAMMETFRTYTTLDRYGRLHVISSTQIVFHCRRILSRALGIPKSRIRVEKPRIGGGFGAKQTAVCEVYPAFVTLKTGRPAQLIYTRLSQGHRCHAGGLRPPCRWR